MSIYLKQNSDIPEFSYYVGLSGELENVPDGLVEVTKQDIEKLQAEIDSNPKGSVVNGKWVAK